MKNLVQNNSSLNLKTNKSHFCLSAATAFIALRLPVRSGAFLHLNFFCLVEDCEDGGRDGVKIGVA
jgi:hypothetical protein